MRTIINKIGWIALLSVVAVACTPSVVKNENSGRNVSENNNDSVLVEADRLQRIILKEGRLQDLYQHYIKVQKALVDGDSLEAKVAALAIEVASQDWETVGQLKIKARELVNAPTLALQRIVFAEFSDEVIQLLRVGTVQSGILFVQHCPMALDNKGAFWLSDKKEIRNPYYGSSMLNCGENKEQFKNNL